MGWSREPLSATRCHCFPILREDRGNLRRALASGNLPTEFSRFLLAHSNHQPIYGLSLLIDLYLKIRFP
ncbi:hypothetical protein AXF42_Ash011670 [Apostasia shenzhenica]|uniref:Uncharacterized protein n=1 Tax=Apostasia shenzhenica TaxID=1088818 RepID=A0A2H9ZUN3_9ASPA|nr:hypothetical protein AXF42_Ash011670 [Apostasia shenzhenica]